MSGTQVGGKRAAKTNKQIYGLDFYKKIGSIGGKKGTTGGFFANRELARRAGRIGGKASSRKGIGTGGARITIVPTTMPGTIQIPVTYIEEPPKSKWYRWLFRG